MASQPQKQSTPEEREAAAFMVSLSAVGYTNDERNKDRKRDEVENNTVGVPPKKQRKNPQVEDVSESSLAQYPFFSYTDHSRDQDIDKLALLEEVDRVPSFPIKLHAILSDPELSMIISWDSHGRSFRILKPREFEQNVLPRFFDHASMPSFRRQVNGWCFRRITEGPTRGSYYEEHFLRGLPWLAKKMTRPRAGENKKPRVEYEPDLVAISVIYPLPTSTVVCREMQVMMDVIKLRGPKAKIPSELMVNISSDPFGATYSPEGNNEEGRNEEPVAAPVSVAAIARLPALNAFAANAAFRLCPAQFAAATPALGLSQPSLLTLLRQVQQVNAPPVAQHSQVYPVPSHVNQFATGDFNRVPAQTNNLLLTVLTNSVPSNRGRSVGMPSNLQNAFQALLQASQNQMNNSTLNGIGCNGSLTSLTIHALALLLENQRNNTARHLDTATLPSDTNQFIMDAQSQALANQAYLNQISSRVSSGSTGASTDDSGRNNFDRILKMVGRSNGSN